MEQIYYSENCNIAYDSESVIVNGKPISADERGKFSPEEYALTKMRETYRSVLSRQYENIVVLSGSGTSVGVGVGTRLGKTMVGLWKAVVDKLGFTKLQDFAKKIKFDLLDETNTDLEALLSKAILSQTFLNNSRIEKTIQEIEAIIQEECSLALPENAPHLTFLRKLTARKLKYSRVKIFTLNYDLLFEQAASKGGYVIIDGFSFSYPRLFNGINFDYDIVARNTNRPQSEENFVAKVIHLYKPHGSLDWDKVKVSDDEENVIKSSNPSNPLMIYPSNTKFEHSYEQPYFEMISRFQQELRTKNTLLLIIGFSFYDKHIKAMIYEALNVNPSITVVVISPSVKKGDSFIDLKAKADIMGNIHLISETFQSFVKYYPSSDIYDYSSKEGEKSDTV
ncbi:SIR2 family protein [Faecalispora jeddahensis]|uniref:SIR2 family protein n=1 Tax=Faecalispora jeddahensis TaxID=1414721 RepID=UPI00189AD877|nr:SIR2 family protein [Faecalispora jeddahensis]